MDIYVPTPTYPTIQSGIDASSSGDTVNVAAGIYYENIYLKSGVIIKGAGASITTINSGDVNATVVTAYNVDSTAKLDGFTITGGNYGIYNDSSSPTINNNIITGNAVVGIYNRYSSSPTITDNTITGNAAFGIYNLQSSSPIITNNVITSFSNRGIFNSINSSPMIINNIISGNGYGISNYSSSSPTITNNPITRNFVNGIDNDYDCSPTITNNTITRNFENGIDNGVNSSPTITNNIITSNSIMGIYADTSSSPTIDYNDVWTNATNYSGCIAGANDISEDPLFVNPGADDFHLQVVSPCIDTGSNIAPSIPSIDFEGDPRILDGNGDSLAKVDMGADEFVPQPGPGPSPGPEVGGAVYPANKIAVLLPWIGLALAFVIGTAVLLGSRRAQS